jgi:OOP family OmpA-OmpF porin
MKISSALFALLFCLPTTNVLAQSYVGFGWGPSQVNADLGGGATLDESSSGTKLFAGYRFNKYIAVEAAYYNIAQASVGQVIVSGVPVSASAEMQGVAVYGVGLYPLSKKSDIYINLGVVDWDADIRVNNTTAQTDGTDILYGVGAVYAFTRNVAVFAEWDMFNSDNPEMSMLGFGFRFSF